jgi:hypothetical protein
MVRSNLPPNPVAAFRPIQETEDAFLRLFPHRYDYIWAVHPLPSSKPDWQTETRHPLSDRLIQQGSYLYGVRFGPETNYAVLDIDAGSPYHPRQDDQAIDRLLTALEPLGFVSHLAVQSSHSGGLHLYFPFDTAQASWKLASAISSLLENAGFKLYPGHLEVFPNPRPYLVEGQPSLYSAHRLPLQMGSYLLNSDYQPVTCSQSNFLQQWHHARDRNDVETKTIARIISQAKRRCFKLSGKADKFLNDLNAEIEVGWTGHGQTNRLLGRIAMRTYVFHHILHGVEPLIGDRLVQEIIAISQTLPGYQDWCQHQHEIENRAEEWARSVETSHYFPYGNKLLNDRSLELERQPNPWNKQRLEETRQKIQKAIADLLNRSLLPSNATKRFKILITYGIGGGSLYKHRDLWHPEFLANPEVETGENNWHISTNLLDKSDSNQLLDGTLSDLDFSKSAQLDGNSLPSKPLGEYRPTDIVPNLWQELQNTAIDDLNTREQTHPPTPKPSLRQIDRMTAFLISNDPILMAEALAWFKHHDIDTNPPLAEALPLSIPPP